MCTRPNVSAGSVTQAQIARATPYTAVHLNVGRKKHTVPYGTALGAHFRSHAANHHQPEENKKMVSNRHCCALECPFIFCAASYQSAVSFSETFAFKAYSHS